jgi:hypothetical protein
LRADEGVRPTQKVGWRVAGFGFSGTASYLPAPSNFKSSITLNRPGTGPSRPLDEAGKQAIKEVVDYLKPYFRA